MDYHERLHDKIVFQSHPTPCSEKINLAKSIWNDLAKRQPNDINELKNKSFFRQLLEICVSQNISSL